MVLATSQQEFSDADFRVVDNGDQSKKAAFEVSGTSTLTIPNASGTIALTSDLTSGYQPLDSDLTAIAALTTTTFGRALLTAATYGGLLALTGELVDLGTIADDAAASFQIGTATEAAEIVFLIGSGFSIVTTARSAASLNNIREVAKSYPVTVNYYNTTLSAGGGADDAFNLCARSTGQIDVSNRTGGALAVHALVRKKTI